MIFIRRGTLYTYDVLKNPSELEKYEFRKSNAKSLVAAYSIFEEDKNFLCNQD